MKIAYFDCFSGASGDMILSSLLDAGFPLSKLRSCLNKIISLYKTTLQIRRVDKCGLNAVQLIIKGAEVHLAHRQMLRLIKKSALPVAIRTTSLNILDRLAQAEAKVHHSHKKNVKLHELGSIDTLIDIVGSVAGLNYLGINSIYISALPITQGYVKTHHGLYPIPAPATMELLKSFPVVKSKIKAEILTPTGAAILTTLANPNNQLPVFSILKIGYGAGNMDIPGQPNALRLVVGQTKNNAKSVEYDTVCMLETNIDNISAEIVGYTVERLFNCGALDVLTIPVKMKKNRAGVLLQVICPMDIIEKIEEIIFTEIPTLGMRKYITNRIKLKRQFVKAKTKYGLIRVKKSFYRNKIINTMPEYEDCRIAARKFNVPLREVMNEAQKL